MNVTPDGHSSTGISDALAVVSSDKWPVSDTSGVARPDDN